MWMIKIDRTGIETHDTRVLKSLFAVRIFHLEN